MNKTEYKVFRATVDAFIESHPGSPPLYTGQDNEFSWQPCECCGSRLGGARFQYQGIAGGEPRKYWVCYDCFNYMELGQLEGMRKLMDIGGE